MTVRLTDKGELNYLEWVPPTFGAKSDGRPDYENPETEGFYKEISILTQSELLKRWTNTVELVGDVRIGHILDAIEKLDKIDSIADLVWNWWIPEFLESRKTEGGPIGEENSLVSVAVFRKTVDLDDGLEIYCDFHGKVDGDERHWAIDSQPISDLCLLPIALDENLWEAYQNQSKLLYTQKWTIGELLKALLFEISFYGDPEETKNVMDGLIDTIKKIKSGEEKAYPFDFNGPPWKDSGD